MINQTGWKNQKEKETYVSLREKRIGNAVPKRATAAAPAIRYVVPSDDTSPTAETAVLEEDPDPNRTLLPEKTEREGGGPDLFGFVGRIDSDDKGDVAEAILAIWKSREREEGLEALGVGDFRGSLMIQNIVMDKVRQHLKSQFLCG